MKKLLLVALLALVPLTLTANDKVKFTVSSDEVEAGGDILLMIRAEYSEMGQDKAISFRKKPGIKVSPPRIQQVSWNKNHLPKGDRTQVHSIRLDVDEITLTEADFTGLPEDCKFTIELKKKKN